MTRSSSSALFSPCHNQLHPEARQGFPFELKAEDCYPYKVSDLPRENPSGGPGTLEEKEYSLGNLGFKLTSDPEIAGRQREKTGPTGKIE